MDRRDRHRVGNWQNWSIKAEYDYIDFGTKTTPFSGTVLPGIAGVGAAVGLEDDLTDLTG